MTRLITAALGVAVLLTACTTDGDTRQDAASELIVRQPQDGQLTQDDLYDDQGSLNVNITPADFLEDFRALDRRGQQDSCAVFDAVMASEAAADEYFDMMWDLGYSGDQIVNSLSALGEVC